MEFNSSYTTDEKRRMDNPFSGVATFMKAPYLDNIEELTKENCDIAVLGMPYDMGASLRSGQRFGPRGIRNASMWNAYCFKGWYSPIDDETFMDEDWKVVDVGDIDVIHTEHSLSFENLTDAVRRISSKGIIPFVMGGDHAITTPALRGMDSYEDLCVIHFDAHLDFTMSAGGVFEGHGSPMRRASEMEHIGQIVQIGMRGVGSSKKSDWDDARANGNIIMDIRKVRENGIQWVLDSIPKKEHYYITFDIDCLDQTLVPGCGSPTPWGMMYEEILPIFKNIASKGKIVGADFVEVCPPYDINEQTALYTAQLMLDLMG
ncbi:MAG: agmatinase, partial [Clostridia bacterium]|nr:agmatinase [Clostridia bacterium]